MLSNRRSRFGVLVALQKIKLVQMENADPEIEGDETLPNVNPVFDNEQIWKAFAALLGGVDVEDVFGEFIVPAPAPSKAKETR